MRSLTSSIVFCLFCVQATSVQPEERVTWSLRSTEKPSVSFQQFTGFKEAADTLEAIANWAAWDNSENLVCESSAEHLRAVALRRARTCILALWNGSDGKVKVLVEGELPAGVYTTERLALANGGEVVAVQRRNGLLQISTRTKPQRTEWLPAGEGVILRFTERTHAVDETLIALRRSIWQSKMSPTVLSRLASLMREADTHWHQVRASLRRGDVRMGARGVHRMLFLGSGIQAVASRYTMLSDVAHRAESLIDALSELSSALLNVAVEVSRNGGSLGVKVVNAGAEVWRALRLALEASSEEDGAVLANIKPMERAEASFRIQDERSLPVVVVSVLFNSGVARLRVAWGSVTDGKTKEVEQ